MESIETYAAGTFERYSRLNPRYGLIAASRARAKRAVSRFGRTALRVLSAFAFDLLIELVKAVLGF